MKMPGRDGTGPMGMGSKTGRGMGFCKEFNNTGSAQGFGRGFRRNMFWNNPQNPVQQTKEQERQRLKDNKRAIEEEKIRLEQETEAIKRRMEELDEP
jgi:hypothetical protein